MSITVILDISVKEECIDEFKSVLGAAIPDTRAFDGCEGLTIEQDLDVGNRFLVIEHWASRQHREAYSAWRAQTELGQTMALLLNGRPVITNLENTGI